MGGKGSEEQEWKVGNGPSAFLPAFISRFPFSITHFF
jgi:hypothetical protein